jgi:hypothetical protein
LATGKQAPQNGASYIDSYQRTLVACLALGVSRRTETNATFSNAARSDPWTARRTPCHHTMHKHSSVLRRPELPLTPRAQHALLVHTFFYNPAQSLVPMRCTRARYYARSEKIGAPAAVYNRDTPSVSGGVISTHAE